MSGSSLTQDLCPRGWAWAEDILAETTRPPLAPECSGAARRKGCVAWERSRGRGGTLDRERGPGRGAGWRLWGRPLGPAGVEGGSPTGHPVCIRDGHFSHTPYCHLSNHGLQHPLEDFSESRAAPTGSHGIHDPRPLGDKQWPRLEASEAPMGELDLEKTLAGWGSPRCSGSWWWPQRSFQRAVRSSC